MRKTHWMALGLGLLVSCQSSGAGVRASTGEIPSRTFRFTYEASIPAPAPGTKKLRVWAPLPRSEAGVQEVRDLEIISPAGARQTVAPDHGNRYVYVEVANPSQGVQIKWTAIITRYEDQGQGKSPSTERHLQETRLVPINTDVSAMDQADSAVNRLKLWEEGLADSVLAKRIYDDVLDGMEYDKSVAGYGNGDFLRAMTVCKGNCTDFHARFMGVARRAALPVRFTMGIPLKSEGAGTYDSYHCWAHWYDKASDSWKPVDISEADKVANEDPTKARWFFGNLGPDRLALTRGRDLMLEPRQAGGPRNYMVFPYAEGDDVEMRLDKTMWKFSYQDL